MLMCGIFIMCFVLFVFVTCFGWNFNAMAAAALGYMAVAAATTECVSCCCWVRERKLVVL